MLSSRWRSADSIRWPKSDTDKINVIDIVTLSTACAFRID